MQERYAKKNETEELRRAFEIMDSKKDGKVDAEELSALFTQLGHKCKKNEIEDMIWEVDEDCDKCVNWDEFQASFSPHNLSSPNTPPQRFIPISHPLPLHARTQAMYHRCRNDKTGYEPRRLFNVVEFLMNDKDESGKVRERGGGEGNFTANFHPIFFFLYIEREEGSLIAVAASTRLSSYLLSCPTRNLSHN